MILLLTAIFGCANQIDLVYTTEACSDWDFSNEEPELRIESDGEDVVVRRMGVMGNCGDQFQPEIYADGWEFRVVENWEVGEGTDCEACLAAKVTMVSPPSGEYHIEWFSGPDEISPAHDEDFSVD